MPIGGATVYLRGGAYFAARPGDPVLALSSQDSGRDDAPVIYAAFENEVRPMCFADHEVVLTASATPWRRLPQRIVVRAHTSAPRGRCQPDGYRGPGRSGKDSFGYGNHMVCFTDAHVGCAKAALDSVVARSWHSSFSTAPCRRLHATPT